MHARAQWLWTRSEHEPTYTDEFGASAAFSDPSIQEPSEPPWLQESLRATIPGHVALSDLELTPSSLDYGDLNPLVDWCDNADSTAYLNSTSPILSSRWTDDSSLTALHERSPTSHTCETSKELGKSLPHGRMDPARRWLHAHPFDQYPTAEQKVELAAAAGMTIPQLNRRLTNLRKRDRHVLDDLCNNLDAKVNAPGAPGAPGRDGSLESSISSRRKGKRRYMSRPSPTIGTGPTVYPLDSSSDGSGDTANRYHCTVCPRKSFKNPYSWKRHEAGVHHFGSTRWFCLLNNAATMPGMKCVFCSDTVHDMSHFDQHNIQVCLAKDKSARVFDRKDGLKQHVVGAHLYTANDYTKRGFEPPDIWSETEDGFSPNPDGLWCGFCKCSFETTIARMDHVAQHFRDGLQISKWVSRLGSSRATLA
ncbi:unnamed protein product [Alternaria alternata]